MTPIHTQIVGLPCPFTVQLQNRDSRYGKMRNWQKNVEVNAQQAPVLWGRQKCPLKPPNRESSGMEKMEKNCQDVKENAQQLQKTWERKTNGWTIGWACISKHLLAQVVKNTFSQKWVASQFEFWLPYSSHPHALTTSTTFGWPGTKDKMGSWQFYGFSLWHLNFSHWLKGLNILPPFLVKSCPHLFNVALT